MFSSIFAAVMLAEDQELPQSDVKKFWNKSVNKAVSMEKKPPVHTTYFTAVVDEEGKVSTFKDLYDLETIEPLKEHLEAFEQAQEELAKLGVEAA